MKTFKQFFEATEKDLKAMGVSPEKIAILKARNARRGGSGFGVSGSTGEHFHQKQKPKSSALARRPSSAITKAADKGASIVRTKASGPSKEAVGKSKLDKDARTKPSAGYMSAPDTTTSNEPGKPKPKKPEPPTRHTKGFMSGVKTSLGGDVFDKNKSNRTRARRELGLKAGRALKSAPGKVVKAALNAKTTQDGPSTSSSGSIQGPKRGVYNG